MSNRPTPVRDEQFYSQHRFLIVQVEATLFRTKSKYLTESSPIFADMLAIPQPGDKPVDGENDDHPLWIQGESAETFRKVLEWLKQSSSRAPTHFDADRDEWESLFHFSKKWQMDTLHNASIEGLKQSFWAPIKKIQFAQEHGLGLSWSVSAFRDLCCRSDPFTIQAVAEQELSLEVFCIVAYIREKVRTQRRCQCFYNGYNYGVGGIRQCICTQNLPEDWTVVQWVEEAEAT